MPSNPGQFLPVPNPIAEQKSLMITRPWLMFFQSLVTQLVGTGDVFGPASSLDNQIALFSGLTGKLLKAATGTGYVRTDAGVYSTPTHAAASVLGRASNSSGDMADIASTSDGQVLTRVAGTLQWASASSLNGYWSELTNGDSLNPEIVFDSFGNTIDVFVPVP